MNRLPSQDSWARQTNARLTILSSTGLFMTFKSYFYLQTGRSFYSIRLGASERWAFHLFSYFVFFFFFLNWISKPSAGRTFVNGQLVNLSEEDKEGGELDETHFVLRKGQICIDDASFFLFSLPPPPTGNDYKRLKGRSASYATPHPDIGTGRFLPESRGVRRDKFGQGGRERTDRQTR